MARNPEVWKRQQETVIEEVAVTITPSKAPPTKVSRTSIAPVVTQTVGSGTVTITSTPTSNTFSTQPIFNQQTRIPETSSTFLTTTSSATSSPSSSSSLSPTSTACDSAHTLCPAPESRGSLPPAIIGAIAATVSLAVLILLGIGFVTYRRVHRRPPTAWPAPATVNSYDPNAPAPLHRQYEVVRSEVSSPSPGPTPPPRAAEQGFDFGFGGEGKKEGGVVQLAEADSGQEPRVYEVEGESRREKRWSDRLWKGWRRSGGSY